MPRGRMHCVAQQIDIMPTLLQYMGYNKPYVAFGIDLLNTPANNTWAVNHTGGGIYQYIKGDYVIQFDGGDVLAAYNYKDDWMMQHNLIDDKKMVNEMEKELKAIIQSYMQRMIDNELIVRAKEKE
jgi:phosphoglycerol transferase MdoB-like AlkP superfamily enzyme